MTFSGLLQKSFALCCVLLTLFCLESFGQTETFTLKGFVLDATTKQPITGVHLSDLNKSTGTTTNDTGHFSLTISGFPVRIGFHHVSYFSDTLTISSKDECMSRYSNTELVKFLRMNVFLINEVAVTSGPRKLFEKEPYAIVDYQVLDNKIVALGYRNYNEFRKEVLIADLDGKVQHFESRPKIREIYKDCLGEGYLIEEDSVYQIHVKKNHIKTSETCPIQFFKNYIQHVEALSANATVLSAASDFKQYKEYYLLSGSTNETKPLYRVGDKKKEEKEVLNEYIGKECRKTMRNSFMTVLQIKETNDRLFQFELDARYQGMVANKPTYSKIYGVGKNFLLFDFGSYTLIKFSQEGNIEQEIPMHIVFNDDWESRMHRDPVTGKFYLEFLNGQSTYLIEIDPETGEEVRKIPIRDYKHIDHVSVLNNRVFFLHQPDFGDRGKKLYYVDI